jgi:hypothetical protein
MGYEISLGLAWDELEQISHSGKYGVRLLDEDYLVFVSLRKVLHKTSGQEAEEMRAVLILHFLLGIKKHGFFPTGEWISFRQLEGGPVFWPAFEDVFAGPNLTPNADPISATPIQINQPPCKKSSRLSTFSENSVRSYSGSLRGG